MHFAPQDLINGANNNINKNAALTSAASVACTPASAQLPVRRPTEWDSSAIAALDSMNMSPSQTCGIYNYRRATRHVPRNAAAQNVAATRTNTFSHRSTMSTPQMRAAPSTAKMRSGRKRIGGGFVFIPPQRIGVDFIPPHEYAASLRSKNEFVVGSPPCRQLNLLRARLKYHPEYA